MRKRNREITGRRHLSMASNPPAPDKPDLSLLEGVVSERILDAMREASDALSRAGVRRVLVGGLGLGANGYPRATKDVDFLVGDEAFDVHLGGLVTMKPGIPISVRGVAIDLLSVRPDEQHLLNELDQAVFSQGIPVASAAVVVYLKLKSPRGKDRMDVIELIRAGADADAIRAYLARHAPKLVPKFDSLVIEAVQGE